MCLRLRAVSCSSICCFLALRSASLWASLDSWSACYSLSPSMMLCSTACNSTNSLYLSASSITPSSRFFNLSYSASLSLSTWASLSLAYCINIIASCSCCLLCISSSLRSLACSSIIFSSLVFKPSLILFNSESVLERMVCFLWRVASPSWEAYYLILSKFFSRTPPKPLLPSSRASMFLSSWASLRCFSV